MKRIEILCGPTRAQLVRTVIPCNGKVDWAIEGTRAQANILTRNEDGVADTVELIAVVPNKKPNGISVYTATEAMPSPNVFTSSVTDVPFSVVLTDTQNREWIYTQIKTEVLEKGIKTVIKYVGTLRNGSTNLMGVVAFRTQYSLEKWFQFDIDINNGLYAPVIGNVYFSSLKLKFAGGYAAYTMTGSKRPCSKDDLDGTHWLAKPAQYIWPKQGSLQRRFIVSVPLAIGREELAYYRKFGGLGFCLDWTDSFGVVKTGLGTVTKDLVVYGNNDGKQYAGREGLRRLAAEMSFGLEVALEKGTVNELYGVYNKNYGPFHPYFLNVQGGQGGFDIDHYRGYALCLEDYVANVCVSHMNAERQPWCMYNTDGTPRTAKQFAVENGGTIPFDFAPFDMEINGVPAFRNKGDFNAGPASRELLSWPCHDAQHQTRYNKPVQALTYLGNDPLAKRQLELAGEINLLYLNTFPQIAGWSGGHNLTTLHKWALASLGKGGLMGRGRCWPIDAIVAYYHAASPAWRLQQSAWMSFMADTLIISQMPTGWNNRVLGTSGSQVVDTAGFLEQYDIAQTFEVEFEDWVKRCLAVCLPLGNAYRNSLNESIIRSAKSFFTTDIYKGSIYRWYVVVAENGHIFTPTELKYTLTSGGAENFQGWYVLNHAYLAANEIGDKSVDWIKKSLTYRAAVTTPALKVTQLSKLASVDWDNHLSQAIGLMWSLQNSV